MQGIVGNPRACLALGIGLAVFLLIVSALFGDIDRLGFFAFLMRLLHVLAAMVWVGLIVFANFVQLVALSQADEAGRGVLHTAIVPRVAWWLRHSSTVTVLAGVVLMLVGGYLLPSAVYGTEVHIGPAKAIALWVAVLGALVMWMFVHMYIWPNMQVVLGLREGGADAKAKARNRVVLFVRLNLILMVPVVLGMIAAAHLY